MTIEERTAEAIAEWSKATGALVEVTQAHTRAIERIARGRWLFFLTGLSLGAVGGWFAHLV